jgi:catabolite regulation protein CreA
MRGLRAIIKILVRAKEEVEDFYKSLVFKNCQIGRIMLQNLSSMTLQAVSREAQHASIDAVVAKVGPRIGPPCMGLGTAG